MLTRLRNNRIELCYLGLHRCKRKQHKHMQTLIHATIHTYTRN